MTSVRGERRGERKREFWSRREQDERGGNVQLEQDGREGQAWFGQLQRTGASRRLTRITVLLSLVSKGVWV